MSPTQSIFDDLISAVPRVLWTIFAFYALYKLMPYLPGLLSRVASVKAFGIEVQLLHAELQAAATRHKLVLTWAETLSLSARLSAAGQSIAYSEILWVDDSPDNNFLEIRLLKQLGASVKIVKSSEAAMDAIRDKKFDVILSDMKRGDDVQAGTKFLHDLRRLGDSTPMVIYTGTDQCREQRPAGLFGITNRPDELIHLVLDVRAREMV